MLSKLVRWIPLNLVSVIGIVQAVVKVLKEVLTAIVNLIFPFTPDDGTFERIVKKIRDIVNKIDEILEKIKDFLLKTSGVSS